MSDTAATTSLLERNKVFDYVRDMLGDGMVEVELDPKHYETALNRALTRFRQRSPNAVEESYLFVELEMDKNEYRLPDEVISVQTVFRRSRNLECFPIKNEGTQRIRSKSPEFRCSIF